MGDLGEPARLPRSHYFVTVARGGSCRTVSVRTGHLRAAAFAVALLAVWTAGSSAYLMFHDDLIGVVMAREAQVQYAYEDRIAVLRAEVDREASTKMVGQNKLETEVQALAVRARALETRADLVGQMATRVGGGAPVPGGLARADAAPLPVRHALDTPQDAAPKPHPELDSATSPGLQSLSLTTRLSHLTASLERIDGRQYDTVAIIGQQARRKMEAFRSVVADAGLSATRFEAATPPSNGQGGPFIPLEGDASGSPFDRALATVRNDVADAERFDHTLRKLPIGSPLLGSPDVTSPFGPRLDPFLGRPAMHTGLDLREDYGTDVRATADGTVVSAGPAGGYGNMVEIDHGHGLTTRYAHLESVLVEAGRKVTKGDVVGQVGATGRATGPHLHYETRIDGEAVDPTRFLNAGKRYADLGGGP